MLDRRWIKCFQETPNDGMRSMNTGTNIDRKRFLLAPLAALMLAVRGNAQNQVTVIAATTVKPQIQVFRLQAQVYTLPLTPATNTDVMVFVNGLLLLAGEDYTMVARTLTFTKQTIGTNPVIQVRYWTF